MGKRGEYYLPVTSSTHRRSTSVQGEGLDINMRVELDAILRGDGSTPAQGHWIIYRRFDLTRRSQYWNEEYRESAGGPSWVHSDEIILCRHTQITAGSLTRFFEMELPPGMIHVDFRIYYVEHTVKPKPEDVIYEIDWDDHSVKPTLDDIPLPDVAMFNINDVVPLRGDNGRIEFYACLSRRETVRS